MWAFLFSGRLSRIPYALMALPLLFIFANGNHASNIISMLFFRMTVLPPFALQAGLLATTMITISLFLAIISGRRLRDIGWSGGLGLPYLILGILYIDLAKAAFTASKRLLDYPLVDYVTMGVVFYGLALALVLLIVPGQRRSEAGAVPSAVF